MEIASGQLSHHEYLHAIGQIVEFLRLSGVEEILVAYGWGCDCPDEQLYQDARMPVDHLQQFIAEGESSDYYRVGKDNLHVKDPAGSGEFLLCHESDIHFITEDVALLERIRALWLANGYQDIYEKRGTDWQRVMPDT